MQTAVVWSCLPFIRSGQNHLEWHSEKGKKRQTKEEVGRQHQEGSGEQGKMEETGCEIICGAQMTLTAELQRRIQAMEMGCCHKILHVSYKNHVTNKEVRAKI